MITEHAIGASDVGKTFAELVEEDQSIVGVWARRHRDVFEVWVLTEPISIEYERHLYGMVSVLHDAFPDALIRFHLINPRHFDIADRAELLSETLPSNVTPIMIRAQ